MPLADPANQLTGTPMGPLPGIVPPNPLMQQAMSGAPPPIPPPSAAPGQAPPSREEMTKAIGANKGIGDLLASLLGKGKIEPKDVIDALATAVGKGFTSAKQAASEIAQLPQEPNRLRGYVQLRFLQNMDAGRRLTEAATRLQPKPSAKVEG